jgi:hypothetical protein
MKGLVLYHRFPNNLKGRIDVLTELAGEKFLFKMMKCSPMLTDLKLVEKGSGDFRKNITKHIWNGENIKKSTSAPLR